MIACMMLLSVGAFAQEAGKMAVGVNAAYGMASNYKTFGFGGKFQYSITNEWRAEASGTYFLKKDNVSAWDANVNVHYVIPISEGLNVYPLAGLTIFGVKADVPDEYKSLVAAAGAETSSSETRVGFNAGGGIEYFLSEQFKINAEVKYQYTKDSDWPVISIGAAYVF